MRTALAAPDPLPAKGEGDEPSARRWRGVGLPALCAACLIVRLIALDADPPPWLSWSTGLYTDEGFYTLDARHEALFGTWAPGNFHDRLLSPLLSLLQQAVFALSGPHLHVARLLSVTFGLLTVFVFRLGLHQAYGGRVPDFGARFLGLAPPFVLYNRLALQETPTVFWLVLSFTLWVYGRDDVHRGKRAALLSAAGAAFGLAVIFKALALLALPAFAWAWRRDRSLAPALLGAGGALLLYGLFWYLPHHRELARMTTYYRAHQYQAHSWRTVWLNIRRGFFGGERGVIPYLLTFLPVPVVLAGWGSGRRLDTGGRALVLWLLGGLTFCLLSTYAPDRYYVLFLPALAALAALGLACLRRPWRLAAIALFLMTCGFWYGRAWVGPTDARGDAARQLSRLLPPGSIVLGNDAPALCLDTPFAAAPVQPGLSNDNHPVERLHANTVAVTRAPMWQAWWRHHYPKIVLPSHRIATLVQGNDRQYLVDVYTVGSAKR